MPGHSAHLALCLPGLGSSHTVRYYVFRKNVKMQERGKRSSCPCQPPRSAASKALWVGRGAVACWTAASLHAGLVGVWVLLQFPPAPHRPSLPCSAGRMWSGTLWRPRHRCWRTGCGRQSLCSGCPSTTARGAPSPRSCWTSSSSPARPIQVRRGRKELPRPHTPSAPPPSSPPPGGRGADTHPAPHLPTPTSPPRSFQPAPDRPGQGGPGLAHADSRRPSQGVRPPVPGDPWGPRHAR